MNFTEEVPPPTAEEIAKKAARKVMMLCKKGDWNPAGEVMKVRISNKIFY